jgi:secreted Zn-dependent insulinase-like peptidase
VDTHSIVAVNSGSKIVHYGDGATKKENSLCALIFCVEKIPMNSKLFTKYFALNLLVNKILSDKFFSILRTKHQLGYIVRSDASILGRKHPLIYQKYYVQSSKYSPNELLDYMNKFSIDMKQFISSLAIDTIEKYINACVINIMLKKINIIDRTVDMFQIISADVYDFDYKIKLCKALSSINSEILNEFYDTYFVNETAKRIVIQF